MLERIGFKYVERIDPFDGGPHYEAQVADVTLIRKFRSASIGVDDFEDEADEMLIGYEPPAGKGRFRSVRCPARFDDRKVYLPARVKEALEVSAGDKVGVIPF